MASDIDDRRLELKSLQDFITSISSQVLFVGEELGWSTEYTDVSEIKLVECPEIGEHRVPKERLEAHVEQCRWRRCGYHPDDVPLPACLPHTDAHEKCIQIGKEEQIAVFREALLHNPSLNIKCVGQYDDRPAPQTSNRWVADFTTDERRVLYDYVVSKTTRQAAVKLEDLTMSFQKEEKSRPKSVLEQLAEERDAKRRRISQRSKKVHTNRKSQTEILREVILNQMDILEEWQKQTSDSKVDENVDERDVSDSKEPKCSGEDSNVGSNDRSEELGPGSSESFRQALVSNYRDDSPWRMLEREGRNPYIRENWEIIYEKHARRNHSLEALQLDNYYHESRKGKRDRYSNKYNVADIEKYEYREKMSRYSDHRYDRRCDEEFHAKDKHGRKYYQAVADQERDIRYSKCGSKYNAGSSTRQDSFKSDGSRHHRRYYDSNDSDGSECSSAKAFRENTVQLQQVSKSRDESYSHKHRRSGDIYDSGVQRSYSRSRERNRGGTEHKHGNNRRSNSSDGSNTTEKSHRERSRSHSKRKKKKKKRRRCKSSSPDSREITH